MKHPKGILLVEDEAILAFTLKRILESAGYEVIGTAAFGEDAVKAAESRRPDIVLMDIFLQGKMNGIEAAAIIKKKADIPIIFITGNSDNATYEQAMKTEPAAYMQKPIVKNDLLDAISQAIERRKPTIW